MGDQRQAKSRSKAGPTRQGRAPAPVQRAAPRGVGSSPAELQQRLGNSGAQAWLAEQGSAQAEQQVQAKLKIGKPNDKYEQEADRVAETVVRSVAGTNCTWEEEGNISTKPRVHASVNRLHTGKTQGEQDLQQSLNGKRQAHDLHNLHRVISSPPSGSPMSNAARHRIEPVLGADLSRVRVHADARSQKAAADIRAKAFAHKNHIYLGTGQNQQQLPLLAHEATHVVQQTDIHDSDHCQPTINRITEEEREQIVEQLDPNEMLGDEYDENAVGPIDPETIRLAQATLQSMRIVVGDVHRDLNTVLHLVNNLEGMESTDIFTWDFVVYLLSEALDAAGVIASEENEAAATVITRTLKVILDTWWKIRKIKEKNAALEQRNATIQDIFDVLVVARSAIDDMMVRVETDLSAAGILASIGPIAQPSQISANISSDIEFVVLKILLARKGAVLAIRTTDQLNVDTSRASYEDTEHYRVANSRHSDPTDNWYLYGSYRTGMLVFHPFADIAYSWKVLIIEGVPDEVIQHVLNRMSAHGIPKSRLYSGDILPLEERMGGTLFQLNVIEG